jgi:hypothetical protein
MSRRRNIPQERLRQQLAQEAARLIHDHGIADFRLAKLKAAERLNCGGGVRLPSNREIETAVAEYGRIFAREHHARRIDLMRRASIGIMQKLERFGPVLVGEVLSGHVTDHSAIRLHVFSDAPEHVTAELDLHAIDYQNVTSRLRLRRNHLLHMPGLQLYSDGFRVIVTVLPERMQRQAPLCPVTGGPMRRASLAVVNGLAGD